MSASTRTGPSRLEGAFVLASYVTLILACACLAWSEWDLVADARYLACAVIPMLVAAYFLEGRWTLSTGAANLVGLAIALLVALRALVSMFGPPPDGPLATMPWPTSLVPMLGPLMLVLMVAKLLRPKSIADHWGLQLIGLVCVGLGCAFADDGIFATLLAIYLLSSLWCLGLFFLYRERLNGKAAESVRTPRPRQVLAWAAPILTLAFVGFFVMPRSNAVWQLPRNANLRESGTPGDADLDLSFTGELTLDPEVAFEVYAETASGEPKLDLPGDQRWRGPVYHYYHNGAWKRTAPGDSLNRTSFADDTVSVNSGPDTKALPDFGRADQYVLTYNLKTKVGSIPFLSDPIYRPIGAPVPVVTLVANGRVVPWHHEFDGVPRPGMALAVGKTRYQQITIPAVEYDLGHQVSITDIAQENQIAPPALPGLSDWTHQLLELLVEKKQLDAQVLRQRDHAGGFHPNNYESVAKALASHLKSTGGYKYSLTLERSDPELDPTFDFLANTRSGHCNRFTSGLALMLRVLRIPCRVVMGFRGADSRGDGWYDVRQCYAHSWVEVGVWRGGQRPREDLPMARQTWHWLTLDPTPDDAAQDAMEAGDRWFGLDLDPRRLYRDLIVNFSADNRNDFFRDVGLALRDAARRLMHKSPEGVRARIAVTLVGMVGLVGLVFTGRSAKRRFARWRGHPTLHPGTAFYQRTLRLLARYGWRPTATQTAREFAASVGDRLRRQSGGEGPAAVISRAADLYHRVRFGGQPLSPDETRDFTLQFELLAAVLARRGN